MAMLAVHALGRESQLINNDWRFARGHAGDMAKDFTHGTEYFSYLTKTGGFGTDHSPISPKFSDSTWVQVTLPHDWVVDLPFSGQASHSHGYKNVGWRFPENSVGWYRKTFNVPAEDLGKHIYVEFDGIFRDAQVFCNGFYMGHEPSGYATQVYDLTEYLNYGGDNLLTVRADASTEEGWFYEGAGIYRDVTLHKVNPVHVAPFGTFVRSETAPDYSNANVLIDITVNNKGLVPAEFTVANRIFDAQGNEVARTPLSHKRLGAKQSAEITDLAAKINGVRLWSLDDPYRYTVVTDIYVNDSLADSYRTRFGVRKMEFDPAEGFKLNGKHIKLKGSNLHQDHAGVGSAIPARLWEYRVKKMQDLGSNAIRCSHNPATPVMLDICDSLGMIVIDENRLAGINDEHLDLLGRMIRRDRNHPCVALWSVFNEEWAIEQEERGRRIAESMTAYAHALDPTRLTSLGNAGGRTSVKGVDVKGYNYLCQNPIDEFHEQNPGWYSPIGSEETSGCGTRNVYRTDSVRGWMESFNRSGLDHNRIIHPMARGWQFYNSRPWLAGLFYWTGFDYRGEPNPMAWPATGSQFGIYDYCGFPKDDAFYLKAWWTDQPVLHVFPHWNHPCAEGDSIKVWAYSNCDEVELIVNGKKLGRKHMDRDGYLEWPAVYRPGKLEARGYSNGKLIKKQVVETTGAATRVVAEPYNTEFSADGQDIAIIDLSMLDSKGRLVPDAMNALTVHVDGPAEILGYGNGDPGFKEVERPARDARTFPIKTFGGKAQVLLRSLPGQAGEVTLTVAGDGITETSQKLSAK